MIHAGLFKDVDAVLAWHPGDSNAVRLSSSLANNGGRFKFYGSPRTPPPRPIGTLRARRRHDFLKRSNICASTSRRKRASTTSSPTEAARRTSCPRSPKRTWSPAIPTRTSSTESGSASWIAPAPEPWRRAPAWSSSRAPTTPTRSQRRAGRSARPGHAESRRLRIHAQRKNVRRRNAEDAGRRGPFARTGKGEHGDDRGHGLGLQ